MIWHQTVGQKLNFCPQVHVPAAADAVGASGLEGGAGIRLDGRGQISFEQRQESLIVVVVQENIPFVDAPIINVVVAVFGVSFDSIFSRHLFMVAPGKPQIHR